MPFNDIKDTVSNIASNPNAKKVNVQKKSNTDTFENRDVLSQLLECSFRGISFPVESLEFSFSHDIIQHRRMDRDGASLENTGRGAISFNIKAPFCKTITRGKNETWSDLYPNQYSLVLDAVKDRTTGDFVHPSFGKLRCKATNVKGGLDPNYRSGEVLSWTLIEDTEGDDALDITISSNLAIARTAAINLDAAIGKLNPPIPTNLEEDGFSSFTDFVDKVGSKFDQVSLLQKQVLGKIDRVISKIDRLTYKLTNSIKELSSLPNNILISAYKAEKILENYKQIKRDLENIPEQLKAALLKIKHNAIATTKPVSFYQVKGDTTLSQLSLQLLNPIKDLVALNPELISKPKVAIFTIVKYYKK